MSTFSLFIFTINVHSQTEREITLKKGLLLLLFTLFISLLVACGDDSEESNAESGSEESSSEENGSEEASENKSIDSLSIGFVPSRDPEEIITATEPLKELLTEEMANLGYDIGEVDITVGTN